MLLERPGELVTREELRDRIWTHTVVDFDHGINKAIAKIRETLGNSATHPRFVETVARRGYRFLADVTPLDVASSQPTAAIRSIAVLPLEDLSGDSTQDYFADGMTDELIMSLGQISALRVISRTSVMSYKTVRKPLPEIARELAVEAVVEGTVMRSGARVRIAAQLIEAPADKRIWAKSYEEDFRDTIGLQHRVARNIAEQVRATLSRREEAHLQSGKRIDPTAYEAYLKGRYFWNKRTEEGLRKAISSFNQAIEADPTYAQPYAGLAEFLRAFGRLAARDAAAQGRLSESEGRRGPSARARRQSRRGACLARLRLGHLLLGLERGRDRAQASDRAEPKLCDGASMVRLASHRHGKKSRGHCRAAESGKPRSPFAHHRRRFGDALCIAGLVDESVQQSRKILEMDPNFAFGHYELGQALTQKKDMIRQSPRFGPRSRLRGSAAIRIESRLRARDVRTQG